MKENTQVEQILNLPYLKTSDSNNKTIINGFLDNLQKQELKKTDWMLLKKVPDVYFSMAYCIEFIFLKFYVNEPYFRSEYCNTHDPVSKDSCVELFISFDGNNNYYNLEFNALGTCLAAYGKNRYKRKELPTQLVEKIKCWLVFEQFMHKQNRYQWEITLSIPISVFCFSDLKDLRGRIAYANIYKCGDALAEPHYLVWSPVSSIVPDFHQPVSFGCLNFS